MNLAQVSLRRTHLIFCLGLPWPGSVWYHTECAISRTKSYHTVLLKNQRELLYLFRIMIEVPSCRKLMQVFISAGKLSREDLVTVEKIDPSSMKLVSEANHVNTMVSWLWRDRDVDTAKIINVDQLNKCLVQNFLAAIL
jgi:hypothetical protein